MNDNSITAILTMYKRPISYLSDQIHYLNNQTVKPTDIWIWYNQPDGNNNIPDLRQFSSKVIYSTYNFKFHGRFTLGLLSKTKYVAIFDDDTVPGIKWFENCLNCIENGYDGIFGTTGVVLTGNTGYKSHYKIGWNGINSDKINEVDLVGHTWFMNKNILRYLWYEEPYTYESGEDIQLSYLAQKYGGIKTYVPPHPISDKNLWGSDIDKGNKYGTDSNGASYGITGNKSLEHRNNSVDFYKKNGWILLKDRK